MPVDTGLAEAPLLGDGIDGAPLADIPAPLLGDGALGAPLAENGLGLTGGCTGVTVGRLAALLSMKFCCAAVTLIGPRLAIKCPHHHNY